LTKESGLELINKTRCSMNEHYDILGIGTAAVDDLLYVDHFPVPDSKITIKNSMRQGGGQTATAMAAAARQGARAAFCCRLGLDELSDYTIRELEKEGVNCAFCIRDTEGSPYHSIIIVDLSTTTRTILHSGGNVAPPADLITPELIRHAKVLFLDDNTRMAGIKAAQIARSMGIPVVADVEVDPPPEARELIPLVDHLIINAELGQILSGENQCGKMAAALSAQGRACCVITAGRLGCWFSQGGQEAQHIPAFEVNVVDTTGCGDVFHGAYAAAIARGNDIRQAVVIASASAALKAAKPGGRMGIPSLTDVENFIQNSSHS